MGQVHLTGMAFPVCLESCFQSVDSYPLRSSTILDSGASLNVFNDISRFKSFRKPSLKEYLICGDREVRIEGYGRVDVQVTRPDGTKAILRIKKAAYCPTFATNVVSFYLLYDQGIRWDTTAQPTQLFHKSGSKICVVKQGYGQWLLQYREATEAGLKAAFEVRHRRKTSREQRLPVVGNGNLWHNRLGHPGPTTIEQLGKRCLGALLRGPNTVDCSHCAQSKMKRQTSRRKPDRPRDQPFEEIWIDWSDLSEDHEGFVRVMFITDAHSGMVFPYFMKTHGTGKENRGILRDFISWVEKQYGFSIKTVRSDGELFSKQVRKELQRRSIRAELSAPNTQDQNGGAERSGGVIIEKARTMRIAANLPHSLWRVMVESACYLRNRTPLQRNKWKSPFEMVFGKQPSVTHLKAYGCRTYAMTAVAQLKRNRRQKLDPKAYIGYLVGYASTNIFKIWIPHKDKVILTRDVLFDETTFFDNKTTQLELSGSIAESLEEVEVPDAIETILEDDASDVASDDEVVLDEIVVNTSSYDLESQDTLTDEDDSCDDFEGLPTPPWSDPDREEGPEAVFAANLPIRHASRPEGVEELPDQRVKRVHWFDEIEQGHNGKCCNQQIERRSSCYRFHEFHPVRVEAAVHGMFNAGLHFHPKRIHKRNLPEPPKTMKDLEGHPLKDQFVKAQLDHLASHDQMASFIEVPWSQTKGQRVLSCMWVFIYKTDKHGFLVKCKARLVVCGNQQEKGDLPTRATTLASMSFRALMAIAAEFDLDLEQMDAVNAFVNCELDEVVYMRMPPGSEKYGRVLRLRKALYGLRRSPLLWQKDLTKSLQELGFHPVPQEPCVMIKGSVFVFFFVDDIIWAYREADKKIAKEAIIGLKSKYQMSEMGEPKWFLGIHILRDRRRKTMWLTQDAYIDKVAHRFEIKLDGKMPDTPMSSEELLRSEVQATKQSIEKYQQKVGSILFAATSTRPDVAFAVSRLARHNLNPSQVHHEAANRVIQYLHNTRSLAICLGSKTSMKTEMLLCASDASFADNKEDRKSSQGYVMMLFNGPIAWKASKQPTVTTSSTEAELLAISEAAKETIFAGRLLQALKVQLRGPLQMECDNSQTIRLLTEEATKLTTQLRHVDIHQHWLRQEVQEKRIAVRWVPTSEMIADGMTKVLPRIKHEGFVRQLQMEDIRDRIATEALMEDAREVVKERLRRVDDGLEQTLKLGYTGGQLKGK